MPERLRLALVVQRYGSKILGGAELHARLVAEHLSRRHCVEVLTTWAQDYQTWSPGFPAGEESEGAIKVRRFPCRPRRVAAFNRLSCKVFYGAHERVDEEAWVKANGPWSPRLLSYLRRHGAEYSLVIFFSYRYSTTFHGLLTVPERSLLVPTAEEDPAIRLSVFREFFRVPRYIIYNSVEERELIRSVSRNYVTPGAVVGTGTPDLATPDEAELVRERLRFAALRPFVLYLGRVDPNKGAQHLFRFAQRYQAERSWAPRVVLAGPAVVPVPSTPGLVALGPVTETTKLAALMECDVVWQPSVYESLSMVLLEAWRQRRPVLVRADCAVTRGQTQRANGGLYYAGYAEFAQALDRLLADPELRVRLGVSGYEYYQRHYSWPVIERKYEEAFRHVLAQPPQPVSADDSTLPLDSCPAA